MLYTILMYILFCIIELEKKNDFKTCYIVYYYILWIILDLFIFSIYFKKSN